MSGEYNFLILEDVASDAELVKDQIIASGLACRFSCVDNEADFKRQIAEDHPDLILSDYSLPTYNGMSALEYVLDQYPDIPVIIVTGSINEETAVNCMKTGAVDYVLKDKMSRLGLAVTTALENQRNILERRTIQEKLQSSEKYYRSVLSHLHEDLIVIDRNYVITDINDNFLRTTGKKREDIIGKHCYEVSHNYTSPCDENEETCFLKDVFTKKEPFNCLYEHIGADGAKTWVDILLSPMFEENGDVDKVIEACRNVDEMIHAQDEIKKLSTVVEQSPLAISIMDLDGFVEFVNPAFTQLTGFSRNEILGERLTKLDFGSLHQEENASILEEALQGNCFKRIFRNRRRDGSEYSTSANIAPFRDSRNKIIGIIEIMEDITKRLHDQKQKEGVLHEKEHLIQEMHHRVNNNMQIMIGLFNMQKERTSVQGERDVLIIAQARVRAMASVQSDIYQAETFTEINFSNVIRQIFDKLVESYPESYGKINLQIDADLEGVGLDLAQPCALIVNELISNSIRHAYPGISGTVYVEMSESVENEITLRIRDDGIGIPSSTDPLHSNTTGFSLIKILAESQLHGILDYSIDNGTTAEIKFKRILDNRRFYPRD